MEIAPLKKRRDFLRLRSGKRYSGKYFTLQGNQADVQQKPVRFGLTVTKKTGNAVVRNRIKRRLRQVASLVLPTKGLRGFDYVVIARRAALHAEFNEMITQLSSALDHIHRTGHKVQAKAKEAERKKDTGNT